MQAALVLTLAAEAGPPGAGEVIEWLGIPAWILGIATVLVLWLRGIVMLTSDHRTQMADKDETCRAIATAVKLEADTRVKQVEQRAEVLTDRIDHLVVDRDAWREAQEEQARARQAAERAAAAAMESGQISLALLAALKDALGGRHEQGGQ